MALVHVSKLGVTETPWQTYISGSQKQNFLQDGCFEILF